MSKKIAIYGASGHGKVVADIAKANGYDEIIFIDDGDNDFLSFEKFFKLYKNSLFVALGIGDNKIRKAIFFKLQEKNIKIATLTHPSVTISPSVKIGEGSVVMPGVVINSDAFIGKGVILNTSCVIEHDNFIGDFVHVSPNAALAGNVKIGDLTHIGIGSSVIQNINIGESSIIGAGAAVVNKIPSFSLAVGVPAKVIKNL